MDALQLAGLKVLVTRPRDQAGSLALAIQQAGGKAILFPLLDIAPVADVTHLHQQLAQRFDLAIFISPNAVQYGMAAITAVHADLPPLVATIGQGSARALREAGVTSVIAPAERYDSEGLLALPELADMTGKRVLILRGDGGRELLGDTLKARGASVEYATCYQRSKPTNSLSDLEQCNPDVITVTSSEALAHLGDMIGNAVVWKSLPLFVPHARIAANASQLGWQDIVHTAAGDDGLLASLIAWRNMRGAT